MTDCGIIERDQQKLDGRGSKDGHQMCGSVTVCSLLLSAQRHPDLPSANRNQDATYRWVSPTVDLHQRAAGGTWLLIRESVFVPIKLLLLLRRRLVRMLCQWNLPCFMLMVHIPWMLEVMATCHSALLPLCGCCGNCILRGELGTLRRIIAALRGNDQTLFHLMHTFQ